MPHNSPLEVNEAREPEIVIVNQRLEDIIGRLEKTSRELENRLGAVMSGGLEARKEGANGTDAPIPEEFSAPLANILDSRVDSLRDLDGFLSRIISKLEI